MEAQKIISIQTPRIPEGYLSVWAQYSLLAKDEKNRASFQAELKNADIPTAIYYPKSLHLLTAFQSLGYKIGDFPISEDCAQRIFSLPMHPYLTKPDQQKIVKVMGEIWFASGIRKKPHDISIFQTAPWLNFKHS